MAYRGRGPVRRNFRAAAKKRYAGRSKFRRSYGKKRIYRKRAVPTKRILNLTSRKKQDNMLSFSTTSASGANQSPGVGGLYVNGSAASAMSVFCPTARSLVSAGTTNLTVDVSDRTSSTCFMRGYRENLRIQTSSPLPWLWRRIVFTSKGGTPFGSQLASDQSQYVKYAPYSDTTIGMARLWFNLSNNNTPNTLASIQSVLFRGTINQDWNDVITAKVDTSRVTVMSDKTMTIRTGNANGHFSERKLWYPMNKNIVYDDDESGAAMTTAYSSTEAKPGMGDMYVADFLVPGIGGTASDIISLNCTATLYWHEK
ncbi:capsid protein [Lynx canadensis faeces associated genomovirus CL1 46]|uniref:Capsid protein n=1 Tax=Lynx canadensis faeces associated genomovirus CL1 46 TaxID=2219124 RepID=A0A2Z5CJ18_9VIRU|nr:capsid protein [Lynx canadensis faeces associated genomovirus CL1 46]AXB22597.1 capsid protein [Lynx canadensis faeces associated genomovirus CL1 46]